MTKHVSAFQTRRNFVAAGSRGFTLLEVVLALVVGAIVLLALGSSLKVAFGARESANRVVTKSLVQTTVADTFRQDIQAVARPRGVLTGGFFGYDEIYGAADADELLLRITVPRRIVNRAEDPAVRRSFGRLAVAEAQSDEALAADILQVEYALEEQDVLDRDGTRTGDVTLALVRREYHNLLSPVELEPRNRVLLTGVQSLKFQYYDGIDWVDGWEPTESLPLPYAVRIICELSEAEGDVLTQIVRLPVAYANRTAGGGAGEEVSDDGGQGR